MLRAAMRYYMLLSTVRALYPGTCIACVATVLAVGACQMYILIQYSIGHAWCVNYTIVFIHYYTVTVQCFAWPNVICDSAAKFSALQSESDLFNTI